MLYLISVKRISNDAPYLFILDAVEDEDEAALQGVEGGEQVRHCNGFFVEIEESEDPSQAQKENENDCSF